MVELLLIAIAIELNRELPPEQADKLLVAIQARFEAMKANRPV